MKNIGIIAVGAIGALVAFKMLAGGGGGGERAADGSTGEGNITDAIAAPVTTVREITKIIRETVSEETPQKIALPTSRLGSEGGSQFIRITSSGGIEGQPDWFKPFKLKSSSESLNPLQAWLKQPVKITLPGWDKTANSSGGGSSGGRPSSGFTGFDASTGIMWY